MSNHMEHLNAICDMKDRFIEWTKEELDKGKEAVDTKEMGEVIDIIKDIWRHAEPEMKERMKSDINALMNSMN